jgi:hypothetical protein
MSYKIVTIKKLKITSSIPSIFLGAKFSQNIKNFLRLTDELQNCCHQEVEEFTVWLDPPMDGCQYEKTQLKIFQQKIIMYWRSIQFFI